MKTLGLRFYLMLLLSGSVSAEPFQLTENQKMMEKVMQTTILVDALQTFEIADNPNYYETNPILGEYPTQDEVALYFIGVALTHHYMVRWIPSEWRMPYMILFTWEHGRAVVNNHRIGIKINF